MFARSVLTCSLLLASPVHMFAQSAPNVVTDWAAIGQPIHNQNAPRSGGTAQVLQTMVLLAVYDAVMAIEGAYQPYAADIQAAAGVSDARRLQRPFRLQSHELRIRAE